jgi:hypothetical protein
MALQVQTPLNTEFGITINEPVWRMAGLGIDTTIQTATAVLLAYVTVDAMNASKQSVGQRQYQVTKEDFAQLILSAPSGETLSDVVANAVYEHVRAIDPYFENAVDV